VTATLLKAAETPASNASAIYTVVSVRVQRGDSVGRFWYADLARRLRAQTPSGRNGVVVSIL